MRFHQLASTLLVLCLTGCGASPANSPTPASNFGGTATSPIAPTVSQSADPVVATGTDGGTAGTDTDLDPNRSPPAAPSDIGASPSPSPSPSGVIPIMSGGGSAGAGDQVLPVKNSFLKDWQATGITAIGGQIYITASDRTGLSRRGTVLTLDAKGKWQDIGNTLLGLRHPLNNTVRGLAADSAGNLVALEAAGHLGSITTNPKPKIKLITGHPSSLLDVVCLNNTFYISMNNQIRKLSPDLTSSEPLAAGLSLTGGMGIDKTGTFYAVASGQIKRITKAGETTVAIDNVPNAVDVAIDKNNRIIVLMTDGIVIYDATGQQVKTLAVGQISTGSSIYVDNASIYVADTGKSRKDSQIMTFNL